MSQSVERLWEALETVTLAEGQDQFCGLPAALSEAFALDRVLMYSLERSASGLRIDSWGALGLRADARSELDRVVRSQHRFGHYDPIRPEAWQRNRVRTMGELRRRSGQMTQSLWRLFESNDIAEMDQLRVLVCDGAGLLAWVGGFRARPFTPQEKRRLQAVVPAMQRRFALQRQVGLSSLHLAALQASLDAIPRAAFVVSAKGRIVHANALATQALSADRASTFSAIQDSLGRRRWGGAQLALTEIVAPGVGTHYLAVQRQPRPDATARLPQAAQRWGLTRRQTEVLELLAGGLSNRVMAAALGCAEGTIQLHVAAVLAKVGAESRAEVVARFWTELG